MFKLEIYTTFLGFVLQNTLQTCLSYNVGSSAADSGGDFSASDCWQRWQEASVQTCRCATDPSAGLTSLTLETYNTKRDEKHRKNCDVNHVTFGEIPRHRRGSFGVILTNNMRSAKQEYRECLQSHDNVYDDLSDIFGQWLTFYSENNFCGPNSNACGLINVANGNFFLGGAGAGRRNSIGFRNFRTTTIFLPPDGGDGTGFFGEGAPTNQSPPPPPFGGGSGTAENRGFFSGGNGGDQSSFNGNGSPVGPDSSVGPPNILGNLFGRGNIDLSNLFGNWGKK
uniref:Uncharacterized protein n=1 Tax=Romanomermis culicivorax TaxID=13658 RepID=A0A915KCR9_ROMCU